VKSAFRKISRIGNLTGGTKWYLSEDCLLAAKRVMYAVDYRRFYLRDLESIVVWPTRVWLWRMVLVLVLFGALGIAFWQWVNSTAGAIIGGVGLAGVLAELALGPTAAARIRTTGASVDLPLVARTRRARKVLGKIDAAISATLGGVEQATAPATSARPTELLVQTSSEVRSGTAAIANANQTNGS
jgi:hypothetical protein